MLESMIHFPHHEDCRCASSLYFPQYFKFSDYGSIFWFMMPVNVGMELDEPRFLNLVVMY